MVQIFAETLFLPATGEHAYIRAERHILLTGRTPRRVGEPPIQSLLLGHRVSHQHDDQTSTEVMAPLEFAALAIHT